jgi:hypothetical protein
MNVQMPDGTIISDVPEGTTQSELLARFNKYQIAQQPEKREAIAREATPTSNPFKGLAARGAALAGEGIEAVARIAEPIGDFLESKVPLSGISKEDIRDKRQLESMFQTADKLRDWSASIGYQPSVRLSDLGDNPLKVVPFIVERIIASSPDMAAAFTLNPAYIVSRSNEILNERIKNDDKTYDDMTVKDVALATSAAVGEAKLEQYTLGRLFKGKGISGKNAGTRIAKETALQSAVGGAEEGIGYLGGTAGTKKGVDTTELLETIAEGAIVEGGLGAGVKGVREYRARGAAKEAETQQQILSPEDRAAREAEQESVGYMRTQREAREAEKAAEAPFIGQKETPEGQFGLNLEGGKRAAPDSTVQGAPLPERKAGFDAFGRPKETTEQYDEYGRPVTPEVDQYGMRVEPTEPTTPAATATSAPTAITQALDATQPVQQHRAEVAALTQRLAETPDTIANRPIVRQITGRIGELNKLIKSAETTPVGTQGELPVVPSATPTTAEVTPPTPAPQSTSALVKAAGIPASAPVAQQLKKLDLTQQADRTAAAQFIAQALENKNVRPETKTAIQSFYDQHIAQPTAQGQGGLDLGEPQPLAQAPTPPPAPPTAPVAFTPDTAPSTIDAGVWTALGIGPTARIRQNVDVNGKDITDPVNGAFVRQALEAYRDATRSARIKANIDKYLARFPAPAPAAPTPPPMTPVEQRVASGVIEPWAIKANPLKGVADVVYSDKDIGLLRAVATNGKTLYMPFTSKKYIESSIELISRSQAANQLALTRQQYDELLEARNAIDVRENALLSQFPDGPFTNSTNNVVATEGVDPRYTDYLTELMKKLGMGNVNLFLVANNDLLGNKDKYMLHGAYGSIEQVGDRTPALNGSLQPFGPRKDALSIYYNPINSEAKILETLAHELGHGIEYTSLASAPKATQDAIVDEYRVWRSSAVNMSTEQFFNSLRNRETAAQNLKGMTPAELAAPAATTISRFNSYWLSFPEWFADNVSRWATTDAKAVGVVEKFFKAIGEKLRALVQAVTGNRFDPASTVADFLNKMGPADPVTWQGLIADTNAQTPITRLKPELQAELQATRPLAPNTPEFKKWFEGSKVVDKDGQPLRVYHAAPKGFEGSEFKSKKSINNAGNNPSGFYFSPSLSDANSYVKHYTNKTDQYETGAQIIPTYLSIKNPYTRGESRPSQVMIDQYRKELADANQHMSDGQFASWSAPKIAQFKESGEVSPTALNNDSDAFQRVLVAGGYDGVKDGRHWVAFEPNQIKSAYNQTPTLSSDISNESLVDLQQMDNSNIVQLSQSVNTPVGQIVPKSWATINQAKSQAQRTAMTQFAAVQAQSDIGWTDWFRQRTVDVFAPIATKLGARFDQGVRNSLGDVNPVQFIRQAFDHARVALDVFKQGGLRMNKDGLWESYELKDANGKEMSARQVIKEIEALSKKNNEAYTVTKGKVATVLEGMRLYDLRKENTELEKLAVAHESSGDFDKADETREKKIRLHMSFAEIDALEQTFRASPELQEIQRIMNASRESAVDAMITAGRISKDRGDFWKSVVNYVPFNREKNVYEDVSLTQRPTRQGISALGELPALRGSFDRPVANVVDNYMNTMAWMVDQSMRNSASVRLLNVMAAPGVDMAKKLPSMNQATDTHKVVPKLYENGEPVYFELDSPYDFAAFVQAPEIKSSALKLLGASSRLLRTTVTATPQFAIMQVINDAQRAMFLSGVKNPAAVLGKTLYNFPYAWIGAWVKKESATERRLTSLGVIGDYDFNPINPIETLEYQTGAVKRGGVKWIINKLEQVTKASDMAARMAVYDQTLKETGDPALAVVRARELINFNRRGSSTAMNVLSQTVPFFNAYAQGLDLMYRGVSGKDSSTGLNKSAARKYFISRVLMMTAMGTLYALAMEDDEQYDDLTDEVRDRNWILPKSINEGLGLNTPVKLSVPPEFGFIFKSIPERVVSYMKYAAKGEDQGIGHAVADTLMAGLKNYGNVPIPPILKSSIENVTNYSFFTHREIVPKAMQERPPALQYTSSTSEIAKAVGKAADVSPLKVDNWLRGTFGIMGASALIMTDASLNPARPDRSLAQLPFLNIALVNPAGSRVKDEFYDFRQKVTEAVAAKNMLEKVSPAKYAEFVEKNYHLLAAAPYINQKLKLLSELRATREMFTNMPVDAMPSSEKRKQIDELNKIEKIVLGDMRTMRSAIMDAKPK